MQNKKWISQLNLFISLLTFSNLIWMSSAHAYLDMGTSSILLQSTIAALVGAGVIVKTYWYKIKILICGLFSNPKSDDQPDQDLTDESLK